MIKNKLKKNVEIFDIKYFGKRLMLYSTVVGSLMIVCLIIQKQIVKIKRILCKLG